MQPLQSLHHDNRQRLTVTDVYAKTEIESKYCWQPSDPSPAADRIFRTGQCDNVNWRWYKPVVQNVSYEFIWIRRTCDYMR